ncbi:hypothetical protein QR680_007399 [Steinernema hermaphroditum]|uniref:Aminopeptidase n=1 Tax=Steinernema hermaphroditum TaxID=289476 RepID=A0AA39IFJ9_9BILA|nr:hypothetical protein QR680_007399 [Steinernema hermaphroditum]
MFSIVLLLSIGVSLSQSIETYPRLPTFAKPLHYAIHIAPDLKNFTFEGRAEIDVMLMEPTDFVQLHANGLNITKASYHVLNSMFEENMTDIVYDKKYSTVALRFPHVVHGGQRIVLNLSYSGIINKNLHGLYRSSYKDPKTGEVQFLMVTQFESTSARQGFPCWDEPVFKAQFTVSLEVDSNHTALSNTAVAKVDPFGDKKIVTFETTPLMSTYLVAMAVGDLEYLEGQGVYGPLVRVYTTPGKKHLAEKALEYHIKAFDYFNKVFDYPYPLKKIDALAVPDFVAGAMENWGLITYREKAIVFNHSTATMDDKIYSATVIGHEVGHFWFGNLVTMKWWEDVWLKEGFATFLMYQFPSDVYPELLPWEYFLSNPVQKARDLDYLRASHPIQVGIDDPAKLPLYYDAVTYQKSAHLIRMLYLHLGKESFWKGMRIYIKRHQYGNAETDDLWQAFSDASGQDVKRLMSSWTKQVGYPVITFSLRYNSSKGISSSVSERRFLASGAKDPSAGPWLIPLNVLVAKNGSTSRFSVKFPQESQKLLGEDLATADYVQLNPETSAFCHVKYDGSILFKNLLDAYRSKKIPAKNRFTLATDTYHLTLAGRSQNVAWALIRKEWDHIKAKFTSPVARPSIMMLKSVLRYSENPHHVDEFKALFTAEQLKSIEVHVSEVKERIVVNSRQKKLHRKRLSKWLMRKGY